MGTTGLTAIIMTIVFVIIIPVSLVFNWIFVLVFIPTWAIVTALFVVILKAMGEL